MDDSIGFQKGFQAKKQGRTNVKFVSNRSIERLIRGNLEIEPNHRTKLSQQYSEFPELLDYIGIAATQPPLGEAKAAAALVSPIGGCGRSSGRGHNHQERRDTGFRSPCPPSRGFKPAGRMPTSSRRSPALRLVSQQTYLPRWAIARPWVDWVLPWPL